MNSNETFPSTSDESEFANFVIPGSEAKLFDQLAERMLKVSPDLGKSALNDVEVSTKN